MTITVVHPGLAPWSRVDAQLLLWCAVLFLAALCLALKPSIPWLGTYPADWTLPLAAAVNSVADAVVPIVRPVFRALSALLDVPMRAMRQALEWLPWPSVMLIVAALALRLGGVRLAAFAALSLLYLLLTGYWRPSMNTLALVLLAVPISAIAGFGLGVAGQRSPSFRAALSPALDLMQTVPAFAYLIPLLLLFGFGPVVGLIASAIYAIPPMVRNVMLGLERVPADIREAGLMGGCTRRQQFWHVEVPTAMPQILVGLNQTTMAALSMVIVAAIIGGFEDIGWEVLSSMRKAEFGQSLLSGLVIALIAILIDRLTLAFAKGRPGGPTPAMRWMSRQRLVTTLVMALGLAVVLRLALPAGTLLPGAQAQVHMSTLNQALLGFVRDYAEIFNGIRNGTLYAFLLPLRIGLSGAATPAIWGFTLTPVMSFVYALAAVGVAGLTGQRHGWRAGVAALVTAALLYYGFLGFPWPAFVLIIALLALQAAGWRVAAFTVAGLGLILLSGLWVPLMQSLYLCALAVILCLLIGGALGVWAAHDDRVSRFLRPINDALQTMPQFVFLIPALMFFKVGEFTALIAVMLYAIVPPIRYVEHGLRHVRVDCIEAGRQCGCTPFQLLFEVKFPLAMPVVMLGLNQTIMAALSMVVIAAMVGTRDLGQQVYIALGKADAGLGLTSGLAIAFIAMVADRIIRGWATRRLSADAI
jgi:glycine betaine/proline transport system permease protein